MCGIAGWVDYGAELTRERAVLERMTRTMALRGPDAEGHWIDRHVALGHRRLAVIDLVGGAQPMIDSTGGSHVVLVYTGEVYNFRELRAQMTERGHAFKTQSDTEVVLRAYREWGAAFVEKLRGMYAFALWDGALEELLLVRDRVGIKPLYYQVTPAGAIFGSEPKAILSHPLGRPIADRDGLCAILTFRSKPPGAAVFREIREMRPGHVVRVRRGGASELPYWKLEARPHTDDLPRTIRNVRDLLDSTVAEQLVSDVPLCTLLSGGLDSSIVTALAQDALRAEGEGPVRSFSVDFVGHTENFEPEPGREAPDGPFVGEVVRHVGSAHDTIMLTSAGAHVQNGFVLHSDWFASRSSGREGICFEAAMSGRTYALEGC